MDRASVFHKYICERCAAAMYMNEVEYADRAKPLYFDKRYPNRTRRVVCDECAQIPVAQRKPRRKPDPKPRKIPTNTKQMRDDAGVIVTAREQTTGDMVTIHAPGFLHAAPRECVRDLEEREGDWKIVTTSTPRTILVDLQGMRDMERTVDRDPRSGVENKLLGRIGRLDMLEPRVRGYAKSA